MKKIPQLFLITTILLYSILIFSGCFDFCNTAQPYLLLYAFEEEGQLLVGEMTIEKSEKVFGRDVFIGKLAGKDIILAESGMGLTNAAMTTQKMIDKYNPRVVLFSGIAGGIDSSVNIGDIVVCDKWATHDYGYYGTEGYSVMPVVIVEPEKDSTVKKMFFEINDSLMIIARKLSDISFDFDSIGSRVPRLIVGGVGVSGNSFIDQVEKRLWLSEQFSALTTDMETAAVAQVCDINGIPFIGFRSASDLAGGSGSESAHTELDRFFKVAANNSAKVVVKYLEIL